MFVILEGQVQVARRAWRRTSHLRDEARRRDRGTAVFPDEAVHRTRREPITDGRALRFSASLFPELVHSMPELTQRLVGHDVRPDPRNHAGGAATRPPGFSGEAFGWTRARTQQSCFRRQTCHQPTARHAEANSRRQPRTWDGAIYPPPRKRKSRSWKLRSSSMTRAPGRAHHQRSGRAD